MTNKEFINAVGNAAVELYPVYKVLPSLTIAQAILESNFGKSKLAKECCNYFGMKATKKPYRLLPTREQRPNGKVYTIDAKFRTYPSMKDGIEGYYKFISAKRYKNIKNEKNYAAACKKIREDGWATDINYTSKLIKLIELYKLYLFDFKAGINSIKLPVKNICKGDRSINVYWLQCQLYKKKYLKKLSDVDGIYGNMTHEAVTKVFTKHKMNKLNYVSVNSLNAFI